MEEQKTPERVRFRYVKSEGYSLIAANGAYGGMTPRGELLCHFFYESEPTPKEESYLLTEEGKLGAKEEEAKNELELVREIKVGIVLNPVVAEDIANWMLEKVGKAKPQKE